MAKDRRVPARKTNLQSHRPPAPQDTFQHALALHQRGQLKEAEVAYREILARRPDHFDVLHMLGVIEAQRNNPAAAVTMIDRALQLRPNSSEALNNRGVALGHLHRYEEALASYERALQLKPDYPDALNNRGMTLRDLKRYKEALADFTRALQLRSDYPEALANRGIVLRDLKRYAEALENFEHALQIRPDYAEALNSRGAVLVDLKQYEEALFCYDRALQLRPRYADALNNRGIALTKLKRYDDALVSYGMALQLKPDYTEALNNLGNALAGMKRHEDALASYDRALQLKPGYAEAYGNRGNVLLAMKRHEEAAKSFAQLLTLMPDCDYALGNMLHAQLHYCNWTDYAKNAERIVQAVKDGQKADAPLSFLAVSKSAALQLQCARTYVSDRYPASPASLWTRRRYDHKKVRIAYVSADFRQHPVSYLMVGLFEKHDRERFEVIGIALRPEDGSAISQRVKAAFDRFVDVTNKSDREVVALMRELEVDIAVDLMGFTADARTPVFVQRCAPIQVNYLGFPATMGAEYVDYIIADKFVVPEAQQALYAEKVVYLPDSFQANDEKRAIGGTVPARQEAGLPEAGFVFCSFNNSYKLNPVFFDVWMRLLKAVWGSVLWLVGRNARIQDNLRAEASKRGVDPGRLVFAPIVEYPDHLARSPLADLFLDSLPFNAGTTTSDALWSGVPVVTCAGEAFAARMGASLLNAVGLPELITHGLEEYEALAFKLATTPAMLAGVRARLAAHRTTCPLFDTDRFRRHIESAYVMMWERHQHGEAPASLAVEPLP
jgi:protein O-GlcNAc transferase